MTGTSVLHIETVAVSVIREIAIAAIKSLADRHAANVLPVIRDVQRSGAKTLRDVADALNARGISTSRGGRWHAMTVRNVLARA
jgi:hypothetical protein